MRAIQKRAMRGLDPTPQQQAWLEEQRPRLEANSMRVADVLTPFPAMLEAYRDPSIANLTNAGVRTAGAIGSIPGMVASLGAGYGAAAAKDIGLLDMSANAQTAAQSRARAAEAKAKAQAERDMLEAQTRSKAQEADIEAKRRADELAAERARSDKAEYDRAVSKAEANLTDPQYKSRAFGETEIGKVYDKTGIVTPFLAALGLGGLSRAATGGGSAVKNYALPVGAGAATGVAAVNWPLGHEILFQPPYNPEKAKYEAYSRDLPPTHPRKEEWTNYAGKLPAENPARAVAVKEFYDPWKFAERSALGLIEGVAGGLAGSDAVRTASRLTGKAGRGVGNVVEGAATLPGRASQGYARGMTEAADAEAAMINARNRIPAMEPPAPVARPAPPMPIAEPPPSIVPMPAPVQAAPLPQAPNVATMRPAKGGRFDPSLYSVGPAGLLGMGAADPNMLALMVQAGMLPPSALER